MDTFTRICKKCLLREMSEADTYKTMYEYIANLNPDDKTPDQEYETRLSPVQSLRPPALRHVPHLRLLCRNARRHNPPPLPGYSSEMVKIDPNGENRFAALRPS